MANFHDLILGCWCLCYLNEKDRYNLLRWCHNSLAIEHFLILIEPILFEDEKVKGRFHAKIGQQMVLRHIKFYVDLFEQAGF